MPLNWIDNEEVFHHMNSSIVFLPLHCSKNRVDLRRTDTASLGSSGNISWRHSRWSGITSLLVRSSSRLYELR